MPWVVGVMVSLLACTTSLVRNNTIVDVTDVGGSIYLGGPGSIVEYNHILMT